MKTDNDLSVPPMQKDENIPHVNMFYLKATSTIKPIVNQ